MNRFENLPKGWTEEQVQQVLEYYENQTEDEQIAEAEAAYHTPGFSMIQVPAELVPEVRTLIAKHEAKRPKSRARAG